MLSAAFLICMAIIASINCQTMPTMVTRAQWNARAPTSISYMTLPVKYVFIHHGAGPSTACTTQSACSSTWKSYQNYHMDTNGWADIGYSFGVGEDGRIYEGRGWDRVGAHTSGYNSNGIGICFIGDFMNRAPSASAQKAVQDLIAYGVSKKYISSTYTLGGHRNAGSTTCPGDTLYNIIKTWPRFGY